jgi:hypothetical protein
MRSELAVVVVERELPQLAAVVVTQLANTPSLQEPRTQSLLVKVANGKRMPRQLHSQVQRLDAMQVLAAVLPEWELLRTPTRGRQVVGALQFSWLLELTTSLVLAVVAVAGTTQQVAQVAELQEFLLVVAVVLKLLVELVLLVVVNLEPQVSNTQVVTPAQLQQVRKIAKAAVVAAVGTAAAAVVTTPVVAAALATLHFSLVVPLPQEAESLRG